MKKSDMKKSEAKKGMQQGDEELLLLVQGCLKKIQVIPLCMFWLCGDDE